MGGWRLGGKSVWWWLLGAVALAAVVFVVFGVGAPKQVQEDGFTDPITDPPFPTGTLCGVRPGGSLECWDTLGGWSESESASGDRAGWVQVASKEVGGGYRFVCGVRSDGGAECRDTRPHDVPEERRRDAVRRPVGGGFAQVVMSPYTACGLKGEGSVVCWDAWEQDPVPVGVEPFGGWGELAAIAVGYLATVCGLQADGAVLCVDVPGSGSGEQPQEGFEPWPGERFKRIAMADESLCGLALEGALHCVGGIAGSLRVWELESGGGRVTEVDETDGWRGWVEVDGDYAELSVTDGGYTGGIVCLVRADGEIECISKFVDWRGNDYGLRSPPSGPFVDVVVQRYTACGLRPGGEVDCFGYRSDEADTHGVFVSLAK